MTCAVVSGVRRTRRISVMTAASAVSAGKNDCEIIVTGGQLRRADGGLIGNLATETIRQFKFDLAVIGCSAMDREGDILDFDIQEVSVSQAILRQSRKTFLVADRSKLALSAPARIASLSDIDTLYTDKPLPTELAASCDTWRTKIVVAES